jgi:hypothetical protein
MEDQVDLEEEEVDLELVRRLEELKQRARTVKEERGYFCNIILHALELGGQLPPLSPSELDEPPPYDSAPVTKDIEEAEKNSTPSTQSPRSSTSESGNPTSDLLKLVLHSPTQSQISLPLTLSPSSPPPAPAKPTTTTTPAAPEQQ